MFNFIPSCMLGILDPLPQQYRSSFSFRFLCLSCSLLYAEMAAVWLGHSSSCLASTRVGSVLKYMHAKDSGCFYADSAGCMCLSSIPSVLSPSACC